MGKHSLASTHKRTFNKTMAVALAAGVSFGGVQVVSAQSGHELSGVASAAEITDKGLVSNLKITAEDGTEFKQGRVTKEEHDAFVKEHGRKLTMSFDVAIPDTAQPGDTIKVALSSALRPTVDGRLPAKTADGTTVAYFTGDKILVSNEAENKQNRKAHFEIPIATNDSGEFALTFDQELIGKPVERDISLTVNGEKVFERTETAVYEKDREWHIYALGDNPATGSWGIQPNVDTGVMINHWSALIGHANRDVVETIGDAPRDAEFRYTVNDKDSKIIVNADAIKKNARPLKYHKSGVRVGERDIHHYVEAEPFPYDVEIIRHSDQDVTIKVKGVPTNRALDLKNVIAIETAYVPGKTIKREGRLLTAGEPKENFDEEFKEYASDELAMDAWSGFASADDVKRSATLETRVKGKDADNRNEAVRFNEGDVTDFELELHNKGNIGARHATVTLPEGMYLPNGETSFEHDFGSEGFPPGSTKTITVKGVQLREGTNPNNFTVDMLGYETLSDPAWTTVDDKDIYIEDVEITDDNKLILHRNDGEDLDVDLPESTDVKVDDNGDLIITKPGEDPVKVPIKHTIVEKIGIPGSPDEKLVITDENGDKHEIPLYDEHLKSVKKDKNGNYRLIMESGKEHIIKVGDTIVNIEDDGKGNLVIERKDGTKDTVPIKHTTVEEVGTPGETDHKIVITDENGDKHEIPLFDEYLKTVEKDDKGDYRLIMESGKEHVIKVGDSVISIEDDGNGNLVIKRKDGTTDTVPIKHTTVKEVGIPGSPDHKLVITDSDGNEHDVPLFDEHLKSVEKDENGNYRLIMESGDEHIIKVGDTIVNIEDDGNGNLIIKHKDGTETKAPIKHTVVTETGEGTPEHKVTITTPDGESIELDVFDVYVTDIKKNEDGDYDIYRSDIDDGKTVWKTIKLKDLRDAIEDLKGHDAEQDARLDEIEDRLDDADKNLGDLDKRVADNETKIGDILVDIEGI